MVSPQTQENVLALIQAAVSKLYTSPLSKTTISLIASKYGASRKDESEQSQGTLTTVQHAKYILPSPISQMSNHVDELSSAVSTGLLLALIVGLLQWIVFTLFAAPILAGMGISRTSDMAPTAVAYMKARAFAAPASTIWLATNGIFRGTHCTQNTDASIDTNR